jgi:hypothetical protein
MPVYTPTTVIDCPVMLTRLASDKVLDAAYDWLCHRRRKYPANNDVWTLRHRWADEKRRIQSDLLAGNYCFDLLNRITLANGDDIDLWSARDALVLKALTMVLADVLPVSPRCTHIKGNGGSKAAVRQVAGRLGDNSFVIRTDVKSYYASIGHVLLMERLAVFIKDRGILSLMGQYMKRTSERGGWFYDHNQGISLGCPLSPLMAAFFLHELDERMERTGLFYVRFMDDFLVLAPSRWKLRRAVKAINEVLGVLELEKHPDKTFIGRIERGFDFLGYHFSRDGLTVAKATIMRFLERASRLYEQERGKPGGSPLFEVYVRRWVGWAGSILLLASTSAPPPYLWVDGAPTEGAQGCSAHLI